MAYATVRDLEIYHETRGHGPRLLFISGTGGDLRVRPNVFDGPLPKRFEVLAFDQRGLGRTSKPPGPYTMADYAAFLSLWMNRGAAGSPPSDTGFARNCFIHRTLK